MKKSVYLVLVLTATFFLQACGNSNRGDANFYGKIVVDQVRSQAAHYQFNDLVGNPPQRNFDPTYVPRSISYSGHTRESAGGLLFTRIKGKIFVLLGKERQNQQWNFMRGSVEQGDSFVIGAAKEIFEETGGVYDIKQNVLLSESFDVYFHPRVNNYACTFFVKVPYVSAQNILNESRNNSDPHFQEMTDYEWIKLNDLVSALNTNQQKFQAETSLGTQRTIDFYKYSFNILRQAHSKNILLNLK